MYLNRGCDSGQSNCQSQQRGGNNGLHNLHFLNILYLRLVDILGPESIKDSSL
jgi:hypothetical protein